MQGDQDEQQRIDGFIAHWRETGGSELANTQSFINGLCDLIGVDAPVGSRADDAHNDYVFERRVFQDNGDGSQSFGRIDCYKRDSFILEAKQGSDADRVAADRGEDDLDLFGQTASARMKRGTARRGTPGWARAMVQAKGQAERYAKALPVEHGWPPFLLVADIGYCIEVYADFTGTGKAYAQFPDRARYRIMLEDLRHEDVRDRLRAIWTDPKSLDPAAKAARVTRDIAELLATVARRIEKRGYNAETTSGFLMRVLFTMFAEDTGLIPNKSFTTLLKGQREHPEHLQHQLSALWAAMDKGEFSPALGVPLRQFNGYLFKDRSAIPIDAEELEVLIRAGEHVWTEVEPAIFGTLLERALNPKERAKLGAHYTPRAYVERLVGPTIMEPLRADWDGVRGAAATLIDEGKAGEARAHVEAFHARLAQTRVLDPACGTGNFLYVAMARMKELEGEVLDLLVELGDDQYVAEITGHTITPENFLGIEINPRAAAIAQLVLWIGYLQWHFRVNGAERAPPEPILRDVRTIENRDALIDYDEKVLERDEDGHPVTRWDGETMKVHPVTGRKVPDEDARVEVYRYVKPRAAKWPKADFIVGNPPFIGGKDVRERLGDGYFEALFATCDVPESADFVMHWWDKAALAVRKGGTRRFGFVTTNSITQVFSRRVIARHLDAKDRVSLLFAIPNHPWVDEKDGAAVRIAMTVAAKGKALGQLWSVVDESRAPEHLVYTERVGAISSDLRVGADVTSTMALKANEKLASRGVQLMGEGFILTPDAAAGLCPGEGHPRIRTGGDDTDAVIFDYRNGRDLASRPRGVKVIDLYGLGEVDVRDRYPAIYQHVLARVKPHRDQNNRASYRDNWWLFGEQRSELRKALRGVDRYIVTIETAKHRAFQFLPMSILPDNMLVCVALNDAFFLGVLSSRIHVPWAIASGGRLGMGDDPRYSKSRCFDPFPFPADAPEPLKAHIRTEAEALDALRKRVLAEHEDLTLTKLYNVLEALREGRVLTEAERDMHDRGLVTLIRQHHDAIDALVAEAYGWPADLSDEEILTRLVALNKERAAEEAKGLVRWLRPEFQAPDYQAPVTQTLDLGEEVVVLPDNVIPWPGTLPEQVSAVQAVLSGAHVPLAPQDVARAFKGKRAATVRPVLEALAGIGMARRLEDGRYAA
ncbi:DNA methyltransferase [Croceicoccus estronivorus]|uniref:class I SAM-dependent DNA methyltransferase n=1 Tax=Croceicoccus estronivorus TaxID=1172626 RepID=UPI000834E628|nr:DNA methyltransferase [Croceicoccus estronivorus]OCC24370.1 DNA methyltransferase [Croceicoccus estronivorus]